MFITPGILNSSYTFEHAPETDPVAVFMPTPVWNIRDRRASGRRRDKGARQPFRRVPLLDIDDDPHHQPGSIRKLQRRALRNRRICKSLGRKHAEFLMLALSLMAP